MIRQISIQNFRGIREGKLTDFTPLVVIVGPNNSGKSAVLDALLFGAGKHQSNDSNEIPINTMGTRRPDFPYSQDWLLYRAGATQADVARISIKSDSPKTREVSITRTGTPTTHLNITAEIRDTSMIPPKVGEPSNPVIQKISHGMLDDVQSVRLIIPQLHHAPLTDLFSLAEEQGLAEQTKSLITDLLPEVRNIQILTKDGKPFLYFTYKDGAQPVAMAGDGVRILLDTALRLVSRTGGTLLIEEPEVHLHPGAIRQISKAIVAATRRGTQIILTTHSIELIDALLAETPDDKLDDLSFYRVRLRDGELKSSRLSGTDASAARTQIQDDLR